MSGEPQDLADREGFTSQVTILDHRVSLIDVDAVQVHFSSFFHWMDLCLQAFLEDLDHPLELLLRQGFGVPVVDARCNYRRPVTLGARVRSMSGIESAGRSSMVLRHDFSDAGGLVAVGHTKHVWICLGGTQRSAPLPDWLVKSAGRS